MLITVIITLVLCTSGLLLIQKPTEVSAATTGSSAILKGYTGYKYSSSITINDRPVPEPIGTSWREELENPFGNGAIISLRITTDASKIEGFTKGKNVADESSPNELYYYYKSAGIQIDTDGDDVADTEGYDVVIYADVETIYAPANSCFLFYYLTVCKSIVFDNFDTSRVTNMDYMFVGCFLSEPLDLRGFDFSSVTTATGMFYWLSLFEAETSQSMTKEDVKTFIESPSFPKKCVILASYSDNEYALLWAAMVMVVSGHFNSIIAPSNLNGLSINLPCIYDYTDSDGSTKTTTTLVAGKTHYLTSKLPATLSTNWLAKVTSVSPSEISSIKFTSNSSAISGFTKGESVADDSSYEDLYYYYKSNNNGLYDIVVYSDTTIYAPAESMLLFLNLDTEEGITNCTSLVFDNFNTSNVTNMYLFFASCSSVTNLDISGFSFDSIDATDEEALMGMLGMSPIQCGQMLGLEGDDLNNFVNAETDEEKKQILIDNEVDEDLIFEVFLMMTNFSKIIAPTSIPSGLTISLPGEYTYTDSSTGNTISTEVLVAGATHISPNASTDTNDTGIVSDSILLSLIALCFVFSGFMMLKKKRMR